MIVTVLLQSPLVRENLCLFAVFVTLIVFRSDSQVFCRVLLEPALSAGFLTMRPLLCILEKNTQREGNFFIMAPVLLLMGRNSLAPSL